MLPRRVVVTGIGTINPLGHNVAEFFRNLDDGVSGAALIDSFDTSLFKTRFACLVKDFNPESYGLNVKEVRRSDKCTVLALVAAKEAIEDSALDLAAEDLSRAGVIVGTGVGGIETLTQEVMDYVVGEPPRFSPLIVPKIINNISSGILSITYGFRGPSFSISSACASSSHSLGASFFMIQAGKSDIMLTGGTEAPVTIPAVGGFNSMHAMSCNNEEYMTASRPFDKTRDGFVIGEGSAVLVLEEYEHAKARGAKIYAEILACGMSSDAYHITAPQPDGRGAMESMRSALREAGVNPEQIDYVNAHGTSTPLGDVVELKAIKEIFGEHAYRLSISSTKSMTGHLLGAAGAVETLACIHAIRDGIIPPTINFKVEDEEIDYSLDLTLNRAKRREVVYALNNNFGFGGHNSTIILGQCR